MLSLVAVMVFLVGNGIAAHDAFSQNADHSAFHGTKTVAGYHIELTVSPMPLEPGVLTRFGTVFYDAATGKTAEVVPHTFVLMKEGEVIFRESTEDAKHLHEFRFVEEHKGSLTVLIENINDSGESAEFSLTVVPEFPLNTFLAVAVSVGVMLAVTRLAISLPRNR